MSAEQYKQDMYRWMDALNKRDLNLLDTLSDELYATDYVLHDPDFPNLPPGPAGVKQMMRKLLTDVIPDMQITLEEMLIENNKMATRLTVRGTDLPTGKPVSLTALSVTHYSGGKVTEEWELVR